MALRFLIDENLPARMSVWRGDQYVHCVDVEGLITDEAIWNFAMKHDLVIVTKDADFSHRMLSAGPPPRVVHVRVGNVRLAELRHVIERAWPWVLQNAHLYRLISVWPDRIEALE